MPGKNDSDKDKKPGKSVAPAPTGEGKVLDFKRRGRLNPKGYIDGILAGDRTVISQAVTLIESTLPEDAKLAREIMDGCIPHAGNSYRIGVTGIPGVGKSTFIEKFGLYLTKKRNRKLSVLAVDPTSERSKGSILGDKVRMENLSRQPDVFIRPSPSSGSLGGVAKNTREAVILLEAAGFDTIIIETTGVGQSETAVSSMVDFFLLLLLPGAGDELQGIKRGIMEMADAVAITKADGENREKAELARKEFQNAISLYPPKEGGWAPAVVTCSAHENDGIDAIWETVLKHRVEMEKSGKFEKKRREQAIKWMHDAIVLSLKENFYESGAVKKSLPALEDEVKEGRTSPFAAAGRLLEIYFKNLP